MPVILVWGHNAGLAYDIEPISWQIWAHAKVNITCVKFQHGAQVDLVIVTLQQGHHTESQSE